MNSTRCANVVVTSQALGGASFVDEFNGMTRVDEVPKDPVAHARVTVTHANQHRAVVVGFAESLNHATHVVGSVQLFGSFFAPVNGPDHAGPWSRVHSHHHAALARAAACAAKGLRQISFQMAGSKSDIVSCLLRGGGQHDGHIVRDFFARFEVAWTVPLITKEDQHAVHPREISASYADAGHTSATVLRDLKDVPPPAFLGHHQKPMTTFFAHGHRKCIRT